MLGKIPQNHQNLHYDKKNNTWILKINKETQQQLFNYINEKFQQYQENYQSINIIKQYLSNYFKSKDIIINDQKITNQRNSYKFLYTLNFSDEEDFLTIYNTKLQKYGFIYKNGKLCSGTGLYLYKLLEQMNMKHIQDILFKQDINKEFKIYNINYGEIKLYDYQKEFLYKQSEVINKTYGRFPQGIILQDEMGLGKTIQQQQLQKEWLLNFKEKSKIIVITMLSIRDGFIKDFQKVLNGNYKILYFDDWKNLQKWYYSVQDYDQLITHYEQFKLMLQNESIKKQQNVLKDYNVLLILDEITKLKSKSKTKNHISNIFEMYRNQLGQKQFTLGISGTPLEKDLGEFYRILDIVYPNYILSDYFYNYYVIFKEIRTGFEKRKIVDKYINHQSFNKLVKPVMIRRKKEEVMQNYLGQKEEQYVEVELDEYQYILLKTLYNLQKENYDEKVIQFIMNTFFREIQNCPQQFFENVMNKENIEINIDYNQLPQIPQNYISPKFKILLPILNTILNENKLQLPSKVIDLEGLNRQFLIFTSFQTVGKYITEYLQNNGIKVDLVSGKDSQNKRKEKIERLKRGELNGLVTTDQFQYGVNLQFQDILINFDIPYTPQQLKQRIDRIHRIGNTNTKIIINLVQSIEKKILTMIEERFQQFSKQVDGENRKIEMDTFSEKEIFNLIKQELRQNNTRFTKQQQQFKENQT